MTEMQIVRGRAWKCDECGEQGPLYPIDGGDPRVLRAGFAVHVGQAHPEPLRPKESGVYIVQGAVTEAGPVVFVNYQGAWRSTPSMYREDAAESAENWTATHGLVAVDTLEKHAAQVIDWIERYDGSDPTMLQRARQNFGVNP